MAEKSGFFNALLVDGDYDRKYNANDYSDNLAVVISNGVLRSVNDDLKVSASGMVVSVKAGRAWINGHYYYNDSIFTFSETPAPVGGKRYDRIVLRLNNELSGRKISLAYVQGEESSVPAKPAPTRTDKIYDLILADVLVDRNSRNLVITDTRPDESICGWVYSTTGDNSFFTSLDHSFNEWFAEKKDTLASVTLFKRYEWSQTLTASASAVSFNIPQYDPENCLVEVFVNGIYDERHTIGGNVITFESSLIAGTVVTVNCYKSIDGTGILTVADEITQLQNQVATIIGTNKFVYTCTGLNDNIALSEIAQAIYNGSYTVGNVSAVAEAFLSALGGNTYLAQLPADAQVEIDVVGNFGATTPAEGSGTIEGRYKWFSFGSASEKRVIFNFAKCQKINIACAANSIHVIFHGSNLHIKNANVYAYSNGVNCEISMVSFSNRDSKADCINCRFSISTSGNAVISETGNYTNCNCVVKSASGDAVCFSAKSVNLIRLVGGTYYAYTGDSSKSAVIMGIVAGETNAVIIAHNINAPTVSLTGFAQKHLASAYAGDIYINGVVSTMESVGTTATIVGQIGKSKS